MENKKTTELNWDALEQKYPLAIEQLKQWFLVLHECPDEYVSTEGNSMAIIKHTELKAVFLHVRDLYDFFDSIKLRPFIIPHTYPTCFFVFQSPKKQRDYQVIYSDRITAEIAMFEEAFKFAENIFENKQKKQDETA
jgi:hypothetical protein